MYTVYTCTHRMSIPVVHVYTRGPSTGTRVHTVVYSSTTRVPVLRRTCCYLCHTGTGTGMPHTSCMYCNVGYCRYIGCRVPRCRYAVLQCKQVHVSVLVLLCWCNTRVTRTPYSIPVHVYRYRYTRVRTRVCTDNILYGHIIEYIMPFSSVHVYKCTGIIYLLQFELQ